MRSNRKRTHPTSNAAVAIGVVSLIFASLLTSASAEVSSWSQREPVGGPQAPITNPATRPIPRSSVPDGALLPGAGAPLGPPPALSRPLGDTTIVPEGENAAFIAFEQGLYLTALRLAEAAAKQGDAPAHTLLGRIYGEGLGVAQDPQAAAAWYAKALELGDTQAAFALAMLYATGNGVDKDPDRAATLFETAARTGHPLANYNLAIAFLAGRGKPENPKRGALHLAYAAKQGIAAAQYDLATLYLTGTGVEADAYQAAHWLSAAAEVGHTAAEYEYAVLLLQGRGINADRPRATDYLKSAARKGVPGAQNRLAHLYREGKLLANDPVEAARWRLIAKQNAFEDPEFDRYVESLPADVKAAATASAQRFFEATQLGLTTRADGTTSAQ